MSEKEFLQGTVMPDEYFHVWVDDHEDGEVTIVAPNEREAAIQMVYRLERDGDYGDCKISVQLYTPGGYAEVDVFRAVHTGVSKQICLITSVFTLKSDIKQLVAVVTQRLGGVDFASLAPRMCRCYALEITGKCRFRTLFEIH